MSDWKLWGRYSSAVQPESASPRLYFIPLTTSIENEGPLAYLLGHQNCNDRTLQDCERAIERAVSAEADGVVFPSSYLRLSFRKELIAKCQQLGMGIVIQVTTDALTADRSNSMLQQLIERLHSGDGVNLVFGFKSPPGESLVTLLSKWPEQVYFTYSARSGDKTLEMLAALPAYVTERLFFHFPFHLTADDGHLNVGQVDHLIAEIKRRFPPVRVRPMLGLEMFDPRVDPALDLEPMLSPTIELCSNGASDHSIEVSVIIPSYNNRDYLLNTLRHLARQDSDPSGFEVIVVDDGSSDGTESAVRRLVQSWAGQINLKYIYSPRPKPRKMGDSSYRAGVSRNLGVKHARGRLLCFLDSDILTPTGFISDLVEKHKIYDVVQCKRKNLIRSKSGASIQFEDINPTQDTFTTEDGYWERFYSLKNWSQTPFFWKYTCTYGLSLPAEMFKRVGWIRRGFIFYGFEDVELGYRLARIGARFHLNDMTTYHLFHKDDRSEFRNSDFLRQSLLAKTAQIFYLGNLEPEIFMHFRGLMKEQIPFLHILEKYSALRTPTLAWRNRRWLAWRIRTRWERYRQQSWPFDLTTKPSVRGET